MADISFQEVQNLPADPATQTIQYGDEPLQILEYWQAETNAPLLVLIHGGCWLNAYDRIHIRPLASALARQGIAVASIEYRRIGDAGGGWPGTFEDVTLALNATRELGHAKIYLAGHSAGGHLALWLGATSPHPVDGVIALAAISDLVTYSKGSSGCQQATPKLLGGSASEVPERYAASSPISLSLKAPALLIHGSADQIVHVAQSKNYADAESKAQLRLVSDKGHFDLIDPRQTADLIVQQIHEWQSP